MRRARPGPVEAFTFTADAADVVVARMDDLGASHQGWINLNPGVREEDLPTQSAGLGSLFSGTIHEIPICTWVPGGMGRKGIERDSLGIQHNTGTKVVARLLELGVPLPQGWWWRQDHPRRGLDVRPPTEASHADQLAWVLRAGTILSRVPLTGEWEARIRGGPGGH
jgi:hypothetical protein